MGRRKKAKNYSAAIKKEPLPLLKTWMEKSIVLGELS